MQRGVRPSIANVIYFAVSCSTLRASGAHSNVWRGVMSNAHIAGLRKVAGNAAVPIPEHTCKCSSDGERGGKSQGSVGNR